MRYRVFQASPHNVRWGVYGPQGFNVLYQRIGFVFTWEERAKALAAEWNKP